MGLADMLIKMKLAYGCNVGNAFCEVLGTTLATTAIDESAELAKEYGCFTKYTDDVLESMYFLRHTTDNIRAKVETYGLRNSQLLTIAPTGTISTMLGVSGGIEPIFANSYNRMTKSLHGEDVSYKVYTPIVQNFMRDNEITDEKDLPDYFVTSADIPVESRVKMQSVWQSHIDASISSTVNLPNEATVEDVEKIYMFAWESGLKGITVYRAGCAREGILTSTEGKYTPSTQKSKIGSKNTHSCVKTRGLERHLTTGCGSLHVCAYFDEDGNLKNTYLSKGSTGGCNNFMIGLSRTISLAARNGIDIQDIVDQLNSCGTCPSYAVRRATKKDVSPGSCCPVAIGKALIDMWKEVNSENSVENTKAVSGDVCPECGGALKHEMGCITCTNCGYSKCG